MKPLIAIAIALGTAATASAQTITAQQADEILGEVRQIRRLLERMSGLAPGARQPAPPADERVTLTSVSGYMLGRPDAPLTLVEFTDLQCPFCRQFHAATFEPLKRAWVDTGKLRLVSRDFPLDFHAHALAAAVAARCAGEQGKFWELRRALVLNADKLSPQSIATQARDLGLEMSLFRSCATDPARSAEVQRDLQEGQAAGVQGTPTFVLGRTTNGPFEGVKIVGAAPFGTLDQKLRELLEPSAKP